MPPIKQRPVYLNLLRIQMPAPAVLSIGHRVSGVLLVLAIPVAAYLFQLSLSGPAGFERAVALLDTPVARIAGALYIWLFAHHLLAGIRFLLLDLDVGSELVAARRSAWAVNLVGLLILVVAVVVQL